PMRRWTLAQTDAGGITGATGSESGVRRRDQASRDRLKSGSARIRLSTSVRSSASRAPSTYSPANSSVVSDTRVTRIETLLQLGEPSADCRFHRAEWERKGLRQFSMRQPEVKSHQDCFGLHRIKKLETPIDIHRDRVMRRHNSFNLLQAQSE